MNIIKTAIAAAALAFAMNSGAAVAQTATPATPSTKPAVTTPPAPAPKAKIGEPKTPESIQCSKEADAKNLHGKERKKFREACIKKAKAAAGTTAPVKKN